jgi:hypothetical protein
MARGKPSRCTALVGKTLPFSACLDDPILAQGYAYWRGLLGGRSAPGRSDLDPAAIPRLLPHVLMADVQDGGDGGERYRFRLVGTEVERAFGRPMTGRSLDALTGDGYRAYLVDLYDEVVARWTPIYSRSAYRAPESTLATRRLMLPLSEDGGRVDRVLSFQTFHFEALGHPDQARTGPQTGFGGLARVAAADCADGTAAGAGQEG